MKPYFKKIALFFILFLLVPVFFVYAGPIFPLNRDMDDLWYGIRNLANWIFAFLALASLIGVIIGGFIFVTSSGDSGKVSSAKQIIIYSLIGVLIGSLALVLINWVAGINLT